MKIPPITPQDTTTALPAMCLLSLASIGCTLLTALACPLKLALVCLTGYSLMHTCQMHLWRSHPQAITSLLLLGNNTWQCQTRNGHQFWARLQASSWLTRHCMCLHLQEISCRKRHQLILWPRSLAPKLMHQLGIYVRQYRPKPD